MRKGFRLGANIVSHNMSLPDQTILIDHQAIESYWTTRVGFVGADADFGALAKPKAIGKPRRGVMDHRSRIDLLQELRCRRAAPR